MGHGLGDHRRRDSRRGRRRYNPDMRFFIASLICLFAVAASAEDMTITSKVTRDGGAPEMSTSYISSDRMRVSQPEGNEAILDLKSGDMTVLDGRKKTYYVITQKDLDDMSAMMKERMNSPEMKAAQERMKNLPPDVQKKMQGMMGGMMSVSVEKTGTTRTVAGMHCENWTVSIGEMSKTEECLTNELKLPAQSYDRYKNYMDSLRSMMSAMGPMAKNLDSMREQMQKLKGFPIATTTSTNIMGHRSATTSEVTEVKHGAIPASAWAIPAGYTKTDSPMKQAMSRRK
jgi:hypothetical protein